jgi:AcrR family transcriptional regulator
MARPTNAHLRHETAETIKRVAREQMQQHGTNGLSLRAIARQMDITAPAIYNYFASLDDLITALIVDAFEGLALATHTATRSEASFGARIMAFVRAYRQWALDNPTQFQLIYGTPIPNYKGPVEIIAPRALKPFVPLMQIYAEAFYADALRPHESYGQPSPAVADYAQTWMNTRDLDLPMPSLMPLMAGWTRLHGCVMLELTHHIQPAVGDSNAYFEDDMRSYVLSLGLDPD